MNGLRFPRPSAAVAALALALVAAGCKAKPAESAPPADVVEVTPGEFKIAHAEQFPLTAVVERQQPHMLDTNAVVAAEESRSLQVVSPFPGRLVETRVQVGDRVEAGQVLAMVSSPDLQQAYSDLRTAEADEQLAGSQLERLQDLRTHGAAAEQEVEVARNAETDAAARVEAGRQKLRVWGLDPAAPPAAADTFALKAPRAGVILAQNAAGGTVVPTSDNSVSLFTLADLSQVWVLCDLYENQLSEVRAGDRAEVTVAGYPGRKFEGRVSDVSGVLDPATRTAKVRLALDNTDGLLKPGMYAEARLISQQSETVLQVPQTAVTRSQDRDYVYLSLGGDRFRKVEVQAGSVVHDPQGGPDIIPVQGPLKPGAKVVAHALEFENAALIGAGD